MSEDPALAALARVRAAASAKRSARNPRPPTLTAAGPDRRDPQLLGALFGSWVSGNGYRGDLAIAGVAQRWQQIVGDTVARHTRIADFQDGTLVVQADSQEWMLQLRYLQRDIQQRIDAEVGRGVVSELNIVGPHLPRRAGGLRVRTGRRSPRPAAPVDPAVTQPKLGD